LLALLCNIPRGDAPQGARYEALAGLLGVPKLAVFVLDKRKKPLMPCCERRARLLFPRGRMVVLARHPLTIRLKCRLGGDVCPVRVNIDPGSKTTGVVIIAEEDGNKPAKVLGLLGLAHRGRRGRLG
jgi:hypothetical protein